MKDNRLRYRKSGQYRLITEAKFPYYTFIPNPLSGDLEIEIDAELATLLSTANRLLGQLEGMSALLPNAKAVESILSQKEALLSCQIDGINASLYDVIDSTNKHSSKNHSINSYISAMEYGLDKLVTMQYENTLLCEIHKKVMNQDDDASIGKFRTEQVFLGKIIVLTNSEHYIPTAPDDIPNAMRDLEKFINRKDNFDALIKAALAYYQFETIHPFMSGSSRVGRILSYLILSDKKILTRPVTCLSHYLNMNKVEYIDRIQKIQNISCDYEQWIKFFVKAVIFAADNSLKSIKNWLLIREKNLKKIDNGERTVKAIRTVYDIIELQPIIDVNTLAAKAGVSYNTGATALKFLNDLEIIKQSNKLERNRDYAYAEFLDCFIGKGLFPLSI